MYDEKYYINKITGEKEYYWGGEKINNPLNDLGDWLKYRVSQINKPLSAEAQKKSEEQARFNQMSPEERQRYLKNKKKKTTPIEAPTNEIIAKGINPRTGLPWSESPGKSGVEPLNSPDRPSQPTSDSAPPSAPMPRKATTMQDVDDLYKRLGLGSYSGRTDYTQADPNASVQLPQSDTSFYLPEEKWADFKFTDEPSFKTGLKLETKKQLEGFNPEAAKNMPNLFGLTPEMSGQSGLSKGIVTATPVVSNGLNLDPARRAFLDADGTREGIRARDRALGLLYASGNYYTENPNRGQDGEKDWSLLKDEEARQVINGEAGAQELLKKRLAALQGETPANAAEIQAPVNVSKIASENEENANPIQQEKPKLTGNKIEDIFNPGYDGKVPQAIDLYKNFNALSEKDRERMFSVFRR